MTGFGRAEAVCGSSTWMVECSSVNRKQLEVVISLPRELNELETALRSQVTQAVVRGRVMVTVRSHKPTDHNLQLNEALAEQYAMRLKSLAHKLGMSGELTLAELLRCPGVIGTEAESTAVTELSQPLQKAVQQAVDQLIAMRLAEGQHLHADISQRIAHLHQLLEEVATYAPSVPQTYRKLLLQRLADAGLELNVQDERVLKEVALYADRCDISEEITRVRSHLAQFEKLLSSQEAQGRAMDFLLQEFGREWNTMGNKANSTDISQRVLAAKAELEKIREQVQNVE